MATNAERVANEDLVVGEVEAAFAGCSSEDVLRRLAAAGVPAGRIRTVLDVYDWPQTLSQGLLVETEHDTLGRIRLPGAPLRWFDVAGHETTRRRHAAPPVLDADGKRLREWVNVRG
jgi:crotonobetainyl-CoA:carnitine CoA-transferase CaiB-like acyl-CoA transferase